MSWNIELKDYGNGTYYSVVYFGDDPHYVSDDRDGVEMCMIESVLWLAEVIRNGEVATGEVADE